MDTLDVFPLFLCHPVMCKGGRLNKQQGFWHSRPPGGTPCRGDATLAPVKNAPIFNQARL